MDQRDTTQVVRMLTPDERKEMLESINSPADLRKLPVEELPVLARALRDFMVESVSKTGGHLSSSLGATELAIALHYVFNTPEDAIVWDVGHQAYAHKILTGRRDAMATLRQTDGISGFPKRSESPYDAFGTAHSSTSISAALGMAVADSLNGKKDRWHIAVIGDGKGRKPQLRRPSAVIFDPLLAVKAVTGMDVKIYQMFHKHPDFSRQP
mgnify:CR=1 FL=1